MTSKVQECCGREFAAKLGEFDYSKFFRLFSITGGNDRYFSKVNS